LAQSEQADEVAEEYFPAAQAAHVPAPAFALKVPALQFQQVAAPLAAW